MVLTIPYYLVVEVVKASSSPTETAGYWRFTDFVELKYIQVYAFALLLISSFIPSLLLIVLNMTSLIKFKLVARRVAQTSFLRSVETNIVSLVLILTFICIFTQVFDNLTTILVTAIFGFKIQLSNEMKSIASLLKQR